MTARPLPIPPRLVTCSVDGAPVAVPQGSTLLDACRQAGIDTPTLCYLETLAPVNACRVCVVEVEGSRTLVPACSRPVEPGMAVRTDTERVRLSRRLVLELLASSVTLDRAAPELRRWIERYGADPGRFGPPLPPTHPRDAAAPGHHGAVLVDGAEACHQPVKDDNPNYVRDYARCILCYKCVEACGTEAQNTFAIAVAGRGFAARISTEYDVPLPDSACVYCGNCIEVCPTGALAFRGEHRMRGEGTWAEERQVVTTTICPYCGVGCNLELHVQDNAVVRVTSPLGHEVTRGNLCVKGRFGFQFVQNRPGEG